METKKTSKKILTVMSGLALLLLSVGIIVSLIKVSIFSIDLFLNLAILITVPITTELAVACNKKYNFIKVKDYKFFSYAGAISYAIIPIAYLTVYSYSQTTINYIMLPILFITFLTQILITNQKLNVLKITGKKSRCVINIFSLLKTASIYIITFSFMYFEADIILAIIAIFIYSIITDQEIKIFEKRFYGNDIKRLLEKKPQKIKIRVTIE